MKKYVFFALCFIVWGCKNKSNDNFRLSPESKSKLQISSLQIDTIFLDSVPTSFVLHSGIQNNLVYALDYYFCKLYYFTPEGHYKEKKLGIGHARNETAIGRIAAHTFLNDGSLVLYDYQGGYHIFNKDILLEDFFRIPYENKKKDGSTNREKLYNNPLDYSPVYNDNICRSYGNNVFFKVQMAYPLCNYVCSTKEQLENGANIVETNLQQQELGRLLAQGYPQSYYKNSIEKAIFSTVNFDITLNGDFYVTYEADSLIYKYDKDYNELECFGFSGKNMDTNYVRITSTKESRKHWRNERLTKGYYNWLEYVDETGLLFRSYQKGETRSTDGLQIYKDGVLIGDVSVPKGLKVMGYIAPYYYSYVIPNEEKEIMYLYRFKL